MQPFPEGLTEEMEMKVIPEAVIRKRKLTDGTIQVLVKWQGLSEFDNTWESLEVMRQ